MPLHGGLHAVRDHGVDELGRDDGLAEGLLLQQLEVAQRGARVGQVLQVGGPAPVLQVLEVLDKGGLLEELLGGEVVQVVRVGERLHKLELDLKARVAAVLGLAAAGRVGRWLGGGGDVHRARLWWVLVEKGSVEGSRVSVLFLSRRLRMGRGRRWGKGGAKVKVGVAEL